MNNEGGSVVSVIFFIGGFLMIVAALVIYLLSDDKTSKKWAENTKAIVQQNEQLIDENAKLKDDWADAQNALDNLSDHNAKLTDQIHLHELQLKVLSTQTKFPDRITFNIVERKPAPKPVKQPTTGKDPNPHLNGAGKPSPEQKKTIKKIKKQMKTLSQ